jgi:hypothetical protein
MITWAFIGSAGINSAERADNTANNKAKVLGRRGILKYNQEFQDLTGAGAVKIGKEHSRQGTSFKHNIIPVPFPGFSVVRRKSLAPDRPVPVPHIPPENKISWQGFE